MDTTDAKSFVQRLCALPGTLLQQHILPLWSADDRKTLRQVSPELRLLVNAEVTSASLLPQHMEHVTICGLLQQHCQLCRISLSDTAGSTVTDAALARFLCDNDGSQAAEHTNQVVEVDIKCCHNLSPAGLGSLVGGLQHIQTLSAPRWLDRAGAALLQSLPSLSSLNLGDTSVDVLSVNDACLRALPVTLTSLCLSRCVGVTPAGLSAMASRLVSLQSLSLDGLVIVTSAMAALGPLHASLTSLSMQRCRLHDTVHPIHPPPGGQCILDGLAGLSALRSLSLAGTGVPVAEMAALARLAASLGALRVLDLGGLELDNQAVACVARCAQARSSHARAAQHQRPGKRAAVHSVWNALVASFSALQAVKYASDRPDSAGSGCMLHAACCRALRGVAHDTMCSATSATEEACFQCTVACMQTPAAGGAIFWQSQHKVCVPVKPRPR